MSQGVQKPCGRFKKCEAAPGWCSGCRQFQAFLEYFTVEKVESALAKGMTFDQIKDELERDIQSSDLGHESIIQEY